MPFWKKSEDPWDKKDGISKPPKEPKESPIDTLKAWNEERKAAAKEREAAKRLPPEKCPWCGKDMEQGYIMGGRDVVRWYSGTYKFDLFRGLEVVDSFSILDEGGPFIGYYKVAWLCRECGKMVFDIPEAERVYNFPEAQDDETSEMTQKEETSEE